jgi:hypothetical protein
VRARTHAQTAIPPLRIGEERGVAFRVAKVAIDPRYFRGAKGDKHGSGCVDGSRLAGIDASEMPGRRDTACARQWRTVLKPANQPEHPIGNQ